CQTFTLGDSNQLRPAGQMTLDTAVANAPSHNTLSDITPSQNTLSDITPSQNTVSDNTSSRNALSENTSSRDTPAQNTLSDYRLANNRLLNTTPSLNTPSLNTPSLNTPSLNTPSQNTLSQTTAMSIGDRSPVGAARQDERRVRGSALQAAEFRVAGRTGGVVQPQAQLAAPVQRLPQHRQQPVQLARYEADNRQRNARPHSVLHRQAALPIPTNVAFDAANQPQTNSFSNPTMGQQQAPKGLSQMANAANQQLTRFLSRKPNWLNRQWNQQNAQQSHQVHPGNMNYQAAQATGYASNAANAAFVHARELERQNRVEEAIANYESLLSRGDRNPELLHRLAVCHDKIGRMDRSLRYYQQALTQQPQSVELLCDFGFRWYLLENYQQAQRYYSLAVKINPAHARTHNNWGVMLAEVDLGDQAAWHFRQAGLSPQQAQHNMKIANHDVQQRELR
ncbi:MAG: tetratricopeptide repeat protein, partial [Pirellulaceae bacterium]